MKSKESYKTLHTLSTLRIFLGLPYIKQEEVTDSLTDYCTVNNEAFLQVYNPQSYTRVKAHNLKPLQQLLSLVLNNSDN